jgi:trimethylamine--corrinoid protein Co-methyltransferase
VHNADGLRLLAEAGAQVDLTTEVARLPEALVLWALETAPCQFDLYSLDGESSVHYAGDAQVNSGNVNFDPGSTAVAVLDSATGKQRPPLTNDLARFVKLVEALPQLDAQSTAMVCFDVPEGIGDLYRLYVALNFMRKPIVTGAFGIQSWWVMYEMLACAAGGEAELAARPLAVFDVCPSPPLSWSELTCQNLLDCARKWVPAQLVSMPQAGVSSPVTLASAVVQHTAESLSGVVLSQLANPGAPVVWGGAPSAVDMRTGNTPMGDANTWLIDLAYIEVGGRLGLPTHTYMGSSDAKVIDAQSGLESFGGTLLAALSGASMVSGAGMLDYLRCQSPEKLVLDAEMIAIARRVATGIEPRDQPIALELMRRSEHRADHLTSDHTLRWFREELYLPPTFIERGSYQAWEQKGARSTAQRLAAEVERLLRAYPGSPLSPELRSELHAITLHAARQHGMDELPDMPRV